MTSDQQIDLIIKLITISIASAAFTISLVNWKLSKINLRQTIKNTYMNVLFDIDKQLINSPDLWTIYDNVPEGLKKEMDGRAQGKRLAFMYYYFNLFEITHTNYTAVLKRLNKYDAEFWKYMQVYIRQFFENSTDARELFKKDFIQEVYLPAFTNYVNEVINAYESSPDFLKKVAECRAAQMENIVSWSVTTSSARSILYSMR